MKANLHLTPSQVHRLLIDAGFKRSVIGVQSTMQKMRSMTPFWRSQVLAEQRKDAELRKRVDAAKVMVDKVIALNRAHAAGRGSKDQCINALYELHEAIEKIARKQE